MDVAEYQDTSSTEDDASSVLTANIFFNSTGHFETNIARYVPPTMPTLLAKCIYDTVCAVVCTACLIGAARAGDLAAVQRACRRQPAEAAAVPLLEQRAVLEMGLSAVRVCRHSLLQLSNTRLEKVVTGAAQDLRAYYEVLHAMATIPDECQEERVQFIFEACSRVLS